MRYRSFLSLFLYLFTAGYSAAAAPVIPSAVRQRIQELVDGGYTPGMSVCMVNADGKTFFNYGTVSADSQEPNSETSIYEIASVTKTFTTTLLAEMVEAGDVSLSDRAGSFLPEGVSMPGNGGDEITLRQLANHTSGLPNTPDNLIPTITDLANQFENYTVGLLYDFLGSYTLPRSPGSSWEYSNTGIGLLGHVLALSQNTDYESLLRERLLEPMGLTDTAIDLTSDQQQRRAPGHHGVVERPPFKMNILSAAGALKSTTSDLATYLEYQLGLKTGEIAPAVALSHRRTFNRPGNDFEIGLGWWLWNRFDVIQHGGDSFGSTASVAFRKSTNTGVAILSNNRGHSPVGVADLAFHCLGTGTPLGPAATSTLPSQKQLRSVVGDYGTVRIIAVQGRPVLDIPGQLAYTTYADKEDPELALTAFDFGLEVNIDFTIDPAFGYVQSMTYSQNGGPESIFPRIVRPGELLISQANQLMAVSLSVNGEGDRTYAIESSTDLKTWQDAGVLSIWEPRLQPVSNDATYFRVREP